MGKRLVLIHTVNWFMELVVKPFTVELLQRRPDLEIINILDDSLLVDSLKAGEATPDVLKRIVNYAFMAENAGANAVMCTCTTVNEAVKLARGMMKIPVFNIDEPMYPDAIKAGKKFGIIASVPTSPNGTKRLLYESAAAAKKEIELKVVVRQDAYAALMAGNTQEHNEIIASEMDKLAKEVDAIVLGQISLGRIQHECGIPVFQVGKSGYLEAERLIYGS